MDLKEQILPDDYPVHPSYLYVADGAVIKSDIEGNIATLKKDLGVKEIKNCDIGGRDLWHLIE